MYQRLAVGLRLSSLVHPYHPCKSVQVCHRCSFCSNHLTQRGFAAGWVVSHSNLSTAVARDPEHRFGRHPIGETLILCQVMSPPSTCSPAIMKKLLTFFGGGAQARAVRPAVQRSHRHVPRLGAAAVATDAASDAVSDAGSDARTDTAPGLLPAPPPSFMPRFTLLPRLPSAGPSSRFLRRFQPTPMRACLPLHNFVYLSFRTSRSVQVCQPAELPDVRLCKQSTRR